MPVLVGTSGWQYRDWRGRLYPEGLAQARWLEHYADRFATVESNNAFYRLPEPGTFAAWAERTPPGFVMAVKASRFLTHIKRLRDPEEPVGRLMDRARHLGAKLGPVLLQLPPTLKADPAALDRTLRAFPAGTRVAVEPRHDSWWTDEVRDLLGEHGAALCLADSPHRSHPGLAHRRLDLPAPPRGHRRPAALLRPPGPGRLGGPAGRPGRSRAPTPTSTSTTTRPAARSATPSGSPRRRPGPASTRPGSRTPARPRWASRDRAARRRPRTGRPGWRRW